jgi:hypothetical protein
VNADMAARLRAPLDPNDIDKKPQPTQSGAQKGRCPECGGWHGLPAIHLEYAGHAAITDRLLQVDPEWTWEPVPDPPSLGLPTTPGGMWIRLTVGGVTRLGYGDADGKSGGNAVKETIGDALRNAAMRFGVGLDLWRKEDKRRPQSDQDDRDPRPDAAPTPAAPPAATAEDWLNSMTMVVDEAADESALRAAWDTIDAEHRAGRVADADRASLRNRVTQRIGKLRAGAA